MQARDMVVRNEIQPRPELGPVGFTAEQRHDVGVDQPRRSWLPRMREPLVGLGDGPGDQSGRRTGARAGRPAEEGARRRGRDARDMRVVLQVAEHATDSRVDVDRGEQREELLLPVVEAEPSDALPCRVGDDGTP